MPSTPISRTPTRRCDQSTLAARTRCSAPPRRSSSTKAYTRKAGEISGRLWSGKSGCSDPNLVTTTPQLAVVASDPAGAGRELEPLRARWEHSSSRRCPSNYDRPFQQRAGRSHWWDCGWARQPGGRFVRERSPGSFGRNHHSTACPRPSLDLLSAHDMRRGATPQGLRFAP